MQLLVTLASAPHSVMTRDDLHASCWAGQVVGDDALTRAIAEVRRAIRSAAADTLAVETIPKTGYRLVVLGAVDELARRGAPPNSANGVGPVDERPVAGSAERLATEPMPSVPEATMGPPAALTMARRRFVVAAAAFVTAGVAGGRTGATAAIRA